MCAWCYLDLFDCNCEEEDYDEFDNKNPVLKLQERFRHIRKA